MTYEYECEECGYVEELDRKVADRDEPYDCPVCDGSMVRNVVQPTSFILRGGGWAKDNYAKLQPKENKEK